MLEMPSQKIRVFMVEDHAGGLQALAALLTRTAENDLEYAGGLRSNEPTLPQIVSDNHADVVLVDLVLKTGQTALEAMRRPETWGIAAIQALRTHFGSTIKIIAYSNWHHLRSRALEAGADTFVPKDAAADELRHMIRYVMGRIPSPPDDARNIGKIGSLVLFLRRHEFQLIGQRGPSDRFDLEPAPYAFLYYLASERLQGGEHWVEQIPDPGNPRYQMRERKVWTDIANRYEISHRSGEISTNYLAQWATKIKNKLMGWHNDGAILTLITVPTTRKPRGELSHYTLASDITSQAITLYD